MLKYCTNLQYDSSDEYPHSVCCKCYEKILDFYQFQETCSDSLARFRELLENRREVCNEYEDFKDPQNSTNMEEEDDDDISENNLHVRDKYTSDKKQPPATQNKIKREIVYDEMASNSDDDGSDDPLAENAVIDIQIMKKQDCESYWDSEDYEENNKPVDNIQRKSNNNGNRRNVNTSKDSDELETEYIRSNKRMKMETKEEMPMESIISKEFLEQAEWSSVDEAVSYFKFILM